MHSRMLKSLLVALGLALLTPAAAHAGKPQFDGEISGIELAPQSILGAALFTFEYEGYVDGRWRDGWGWIAITHEDLPEIEGGQSLITGGFGKLYIGLKCYDVEVNGGILELFDDHDTLEFDDDYLVYVEFDIEGFFTKPAPHDFLGLLSHVPFPPTIVGTLAPASPVP